MRAVSLFVFLCLFWWMLSGQTSAYLLTMGALCCAFVTWLSVRMGIVDSEGHPIQVALRFMLYLPWLLWQVFVSNIDVARRVWSPKLPIDPQFVEVPYDTQTAIGTVTFANSITLTPGTVSVRVMPGHILVHALTAESAESLFKGDMLRRCRILEGTESASAAGTAPATSADDAKSHGDPKDAKEEGGTS